MAHRVRIVAIEPHCRRQCPVNLPGIPGAGPDCVDMRAGPDPFFLQDRFFRGRQGADDIRVLYRFFYGRTGFNRQIGFRFRVFRKSLGPGPYGVKYPDALQREDFLQGPQM